MTIPMTVVAKYQSYKNVTPLNTAKIIKSKPPANPSNPSVILIALTREIVKRKVKGIIHRHNIKKSDSDQTMIGHKWTHSTHSLTKKKTLIAPAMTTITTNLTRADRPLTLPMPLMLKISSIKPSNPIAKNEPKRMNVSLCETRENLLNHKY